MVNIEIKGVGIDIIEVNRVRDLFNKFKENFIERVFTERESKYCFNKANPFIHLALRICAKEAVAKAIGWSNWAVPWLEIEYSVDGDRPEVILIGKAKSKADENGISKIIASGSHSHHYAICNAIAISFNEKEERS
ncbi:MAG: holo-ACP synthase [bacterium]